MVNLFNLDIKQITHDGSIVVLMKLNGDVVYEYDGVIEYPYVEYTVDRNSTDPLNHSITSDGSDPITYYYSLPRVYTNNSNDYNCNYKKIEITLLDGTITDDIVTPCNLIDKVKIWFSQKTYRIDFASHSDYDLHTNLTSLIYCDISKMKSLYYMFFNCEKLESINVSNWNTSKITDMSYMFYDCNKLTSIDVSGFNTSNVTSMDAMFCNCNSLTTLDVSGFNTSNVTSMKDMFLDCYLLTTLDVSNFDTSNVTDTTGMFARCKSLTSLDVSKFDTSNVTDMSYMFQYCTELTSLDVSKFDTSKVTDMRSVFYRCRNLISLDCSSWDVGEVDFFTNAFYNCLNLTDFKAPKNINANMDVSTCTNLTHDSLVSIINNLATATWTKTLTLGETNLAKLTDAEKAIAINKGWTLA